MKIAICEENERDLQQLQQALCAFGQMHPSVALDPDSFASVQALLLRQTGRYDLLVLDAAMAQRGGQELAHRLRAAGRTAVIFTGGADAPTLDAWEMGAAQYLRKPVQPQLLFQALDAVLAALPVQNSSFMVSTTDGIVNLYYHNIVYVECVRHLAYFHLADRTTVCSRTLRQSFVSYIAQLLADARFLHPHHSYCVNRGFAYRLGPRTLELYGGQVVPVAKERFSETKRRFLEKEGATTVEA